MPVRKATTSDARGCRRVLATVVALCVAALPTACRDRPRDAERASPTRGYILISVDTLRADHLGVYGYERPTSPFLDRLASRATLFDRAIVQLPGTLPSHMSIFTGLYPAEHGVYPPDAVLSADVPTLPERFRAAGYRTAGFTEGGYAAGRYGFERGFDRFTDESDRGPRALEETLDEARDFLGSLDPDEPFFLFIHTYSVHTPYEPVEPYRSLFWERPPPDTFAPTGPNLVDVNRGLRDLSDEALAYFEALYDAGIRYMDDRLAELWDDLGALGLQDEVTLVVTSDHGEEFLEHGKLVHEQIYPETLHVPLLIVHPEIGEGRRVRSLVESVDIAPTLYELAGIADPGTSGESLAGFLFGDPEPPRSEAYAEAFASPARTLLWQEDGVHQVLVTGLAVEQGGAWAMGSLTFDWLGSELPLELSAFHRARTVTVSVNGRVAETLEVGTAPAPARLELPGDSKKVVTLSAPDCDVPADLGVNDDTRCLSFRVSGVPLVRTALFDLSRDPGATSDVSLQRPDLLAGLVARLQGLAFTAAGAPEFRELDERARERLRALGYLR